MLFKRSKLSGVTGSHIPENKALSRPTLEGLEARCLLDASAFVRGLYADILHRSNPAQGEVSGWVSQIQSGLSKSSVVAAFVGSNEHRAVLVSDDYTSLLGRPVDQPSLDFWTHQMASGLREDQVRVAVLGSQEYLEHQGNTNASFVDSLYEIELHRGADDASRIFWINQLAAGAARGQVGAQIAGSHEAHLRDVDDVYQEILHRTGDDNGRDNWAAALDNGATQSSVISAFAGSKEYFDDHGAGG
jgi:hypothetical protein